MCPSLDPTLEEAHKKGVLQNCPKQFFRYMALELISDCPVPDDSEALSFANSMVKKYPIFADRDCYLSNPTAVRIL